MNFYTITVTDIMNAETYVPSAQKMEFVRAVALNCFDTLDITSSNGADHASPLPSCYKVNTEKRARYLMAALVGMYFRKEYEKENEDTDRWMMSACEYDAYAGGHILDALNRFKNVSELRDKCYDILSDYKELVYRLDSDIKGLMSAMNDPASRILAYIEAASSPEELKKAMQAAAENKQILDQYIANRETIMQEAISEDSKEVNHETEEL